MSEQPQAPPPPGPTGAGDEFTLNSNDRLLAALGYVIWLVALVVILMDETKSKPLLKDHAAQALGFAVVSFLYSIVATFVFVCVTIVTLGIGALFLWFIYFLPLVAGIYFAYLAYTQDGLVEIPWLTGFMAQQGWLETRPPSAQTSL